MYWITVLYGYPQDPAEFERYYYQTHLPLPAKMQGLKGVTIGMVESVDPSQNGQFGS